MVKHLPCAPVDGVQRCKRCGRWLGIVLMLSSACGGDVNEKLARLSEARQLAAGLTVQFVKAADATNLAVMADTDTVSVAFESEAEHAKQSVEKTAGALRPILQELDYDDEIGLLQEFVSRFAEYSALDRRILELAVENTNYKAHQLSFGPAQASADAFRDALGGISAGLAGPDKWHAEALAATALAAVREIQALQAPHIADADDAVMTRLEQRMAGAEAAARSSLATLKSMAPPASGSRLRAATTALDQFVDVGKQMIALSRRNTDVQSLALSMNEKRRLVQVCETALRSLQDALAKRGYPRGRY